MSRATYIISCDLQKRIAQMAHCGIVVPDECLELTSSFQKGVQSLVSEGYPNDEVLLLDVDKMSSDVLRLVTKVQGGRDVFVVSTSVDFAVPRRGCTLEVNRLIDESGSIIGIGPRPGHIPLNEQFAGIVRLVGGRPVILVEDGVFSGVTSENIIKGLSQHGVKVTDVVACFAFPHGVERLASVTKNVQVHYVHALESLRDWVPDHDFLPAAPNCGRVIGLKLANSFVPYYDKCGTSFSVPYILPFSPINDWASIPSGMALQFSSFCLRTAVEFYDRLNVANGRGIEFADSHNINPRVSVPVTINSKVFPSKHREVHEHLYSILKEFD